MASGPLAGGGAGGDGSRERQRWSESKVYTRKSHTKAPRPAAPTPNPHPPVSSRQNPAPTADDVNSSLQNPPRRIHSSAASDDDASSLNRPADHPHALSRKNRQHHPTSGRRPSVTISLSSRSRHEARELRQRLAAELEKVRALARKLEARELHLVTSSPGRAPSAHAAGYTHSGLSASDPSTPALAKRAPPNSQVASAASHHRQLSVSVAAGLGTDQSLKEAMEKEKRAPKANQYYRNSDFIVGNEKSSLPPDHKKSKANGSKKHALGDVNYSTQMAKRKLYTQAFKSCEALLAKLMKHKYGWVFNTPVDVKGLGLHDYHIVIKHPMDLGTVKTRLDKNRYNSPGELAEDVRLTFSNAMTYNAKGQDVHVMADQLSQIFEERWPTIEAEYAYLSHPQPTKKPPLLDMRTLERSDSTLHPMAVDTRTNSVNHATHVGRPPALKKPKAKDPQKRDMTFEEKQRLSNNLQNLPTEKLDSVVQIIKKRNSTLSQNDDEIEVDIDSVDVETLWELDRFVTNYKKSLSKNKKKAELAVLARAESKQNAGEGMAERVPEPVVMEVPKESNTAADAKEVASSSPVGREKGGDIGTRSSSSSSDSRSSSSDSGSESSSAYGTDAAHSPGT